jgi:hypothetical protein
MTQVSAWHLRNGSSAKEILRRQLRFELEWREAAYRLSLESRPADMLPKPSDGHSDSLLRVEGRHSADWIAHNELDADIGAGAVSGVG